MKQDAAQTPIDAIVQANLGRRRFLTQAGVLRMGAAATLTLGNARRAYADTEAQQEAQEQSEQAKDTVKEIFTAALIAEDLATVFYYNALVGPVIQDPNLAGPGGSATDVTAAGNAGNVNYVQAALSAEIEHANLSEACWAERRRRETRSRLFIFPRGRSTRWLTLQDC